MSLKVDELYYKQDKFPDEKSGQVVHFIVKSLLVISSSFIGSIVC